MVTGALCPLTMSVPAAVGDVAAAVVSSQLQAADTTAVVGEEVGAVLSASTHQVIDSAERDAAAAGATRHRNP